MRLLNLLRQRLAWRLLLSYFLVLIIGVVSLDVAAELQAPRTLARNLARLPGLQGIDAAVLADLQVTLQRSEHDELMVGTLIGARVAIAASAFITHRILVPIQAMKSASQQIAAGDYRQRIEPPGQDELGALARSFNQMAEALEQTERRRTELIGDVAHELRTPLSSIRSALEGIVDGVLPSDADTLVELLRDTRRMQRLVHDLEELSRAEAGQVHLELHPRAMGDLISVVAQRLGPQYEDKGVDLRLEVGPDLPLRPMDANRMTQVLVNLLGNALQYTSAGGHVSVRAWCDRDALLVAVQDTGAGIPAEHLPHIFERFYRVDKSRSRSSGGNGIGLTIAKHLVEAHGGHIWAASPGLDRGSTFTFSLPRQSIMQS